MFSSFDPGRRRFRCTFGYSTRNPHLHRGYRCGRIAGTSISRGNCRGGFKQAVDYWRVLIYILCNTCRDEREKCSLYVASSMTLHQRTFYFPNRHVFLIFPEKEQQISLESEKTGSERFVKSELLCWVKPKSPVERKFTNGFASIEKGSRWSCCMNYVLLFQGTVLLWE